MKRISIGQYVNMLNLRVRGRNWIVKGLFDNGIMTIAQLCAKSEADVMQINIINGKNMVCLQEALEEYGLRLGMSAEELADYKRAYWIDYNREYRKRNKQSKA